MNSSLTFENYQRQRTGRTRRRSNRVSFLGFTRGSIVEVVRFSGERGKRNRIDFIISFVRLHFLIQQYRKFCFCFSRWLRDSCAVELEAEKASTDGVQRISLCPLMPSLVTLSTRQISDSTSRLAYSQGSQSTSRWPKTQGFVSSLRSKVPAFYSAASLRSRRNGERLSRFACIAESPTAVDDGRLSVSEIWVRRERGKTRH